MNSYGTTDNFTCGKNADGDAAAAVPDGNDAQHEHCFSVRRDPVVGRFAVADRDIHPLEVVLNEPPTVVSPHMRGAVCLVCLRKVKHEGRDDCWCGDCGLLVCPDDEECRIAHPATAECRVFAGNRELRDRVRADRESGDPGWHVVPNACVGVLRYIALMKKLREEEEEERRSGLEEESGCWSTREELDRLMDHGSDLDADPVVGPHLRRMCDFLSAAGVPESDVRRAYGVIRVNAFGYSSEKGGEGGALFARVSLFSHSCSPNMQHIQDPKTGTMSLVVQRRIPKGEELTVTYINQFQGPISRRRLLRSQWYFDCLCARCRDASECGTRADALMCAPCADAGGETWVRPVDHLKEESEWTCPEGHTLTAAQADEVEKEVMAAWQDVEQQDLSACEAHLKDVCLVRLGPRHHFTLKVKSHLVMLHGLREKEDGNMAREVLQRRVGYCRDVLEYLWKIDPEQTRKMGVFLIELNRPLTLLTKMDFVDGKLDRASYLKRLAEIAKAERRAKTVMGYYNDYGIGDVVNGTAAAKEKDDGGQQQEDRGN